MLRFLLIFISGGIVLFPILILGLLFNAEPDQKGVDGEIYTDTHPASVNQVVSVQARTERRPNIVVILADDLGYGDIGPNGNTTLHTPSINQMANEGVRFTNHYASASVCSPSRASLLTGRYPLRTGITNALQAGDDTLARKTIYKLGVALAKLSSTDLIGGQAAVKGLPSSEITMAESLQQAGYKTMGIGKWHLGDFTTMPEYHPHNHGFDQFVGFNMSNDDFPVAFYRNQEKIVDDIGAEQSQYTKIFTEAALKFMEENKEQPFFIYLAHKDVHLPFFPSEEFKGTSKAGLYGDVVNEFDWSTGQVLSKINQLGLDDDTLVILTSDNGPWYEGSAGEFRGRKGQSNEGGFRVPFIARWPGHIPNDKVIHEASMGIDLFPTFMSLAGVNLPNDRIIDGVDISAILTGEKSQLAERPLFFFKDFDLEAVRKGPWKYFDSFSRYVWPVPVDKPDTIAGKIMAGRAYTPEGTDIVIPVGPELPELHNLDFDKSESYNVAKRYPDKTQEMQTIYKDFRKEFYENPRGWKQ